MARGHHITLRFLRLPAVVAGALAFAGALAVGGTVAADSASASPRLLAPSKACPNQMNRSLPVRRQVRIMRCMHNFARRKQGRRPLNRRSALHWSANRKAREILACQEFSHTACGRDPFYWLRRAGFMRGCYGVNENIAYGSGRGGTVRGIMRSWLRSRAHRQALLSGRNRVFGIGMARGSYRGISGVQSWTAHFGYRC